MIVRKFFHFVFIQLRSPIRISSTYYVKSKKRKKKRNKKEAYWMKNEFSCFNQWIQLTQLPNKSSNSK